MAGGPFRTINAADDVILSAAQWNTGFRQLPRQIQDMMRYLMFGDDVPSNGWAGVLGGLEVSTVAGTMNVSVTPGLAFFYNAGSISPLISRFGVVPLEDTTVLTLSDADATNDRIDLISIHAPPGTDVEQSTMTYEGTPANRDIIFGAIPEVVVTEGVADGSLAVPATPSGHIALARVRVQSAENNLDNAVLTDLRTRVLNLGTEWWVNAHGLSAVAGNFTTGDSGDIAITYGTSAAVGAGFTATKSGTDPVVFQILIPITLPENARRVTGGRLRYSSATFGGTFSATASLWLVGSTINTVGSVALTNGGSGEVEIAAPTEQEIAGRAAVWQVLVSNTGSPDGNGNVAIFTASAEVSA